ncbi:iron chaperone [Massilia sp. IC2-278]|uniref:iron chaperone n=1 Tax=Massilia sp. IC2-278 TaxID=2887200 RepID=UPI001E589AA5|nr:iron chaperone [Massilia sp. IC2-278]MCC2961142.1 iron chaperone [Massilia sp. IC2-278]
MAVWDDFVANIGQPGQRERMRKVLDWVARSFPQLAPRMAWNQPMFTDHGTFIIGFSAAKHHMAIAPESAAIERFAAAIGAAGYTHTPNLIRVPWTAPVDFPLLEQLIAFNLGDKADCQSFWRKQ